MRDFFRYFLEHFRDSRWFKLYIGSLVLAFGLVTAYFYTWNRLLAFGAIPLTALSGFFLARAQKERIKDASSVFEEESDRNRARSRLRKAGVREEDIDAGERAFDERRQANVVALEYLTQITLLNPRDVIRAENTLRIHFGILNRNKVKLHDDLAQKTAKWVMIREFAPGLAVFLEEEGSAAMRELEAGEEAQLKEFLTAKFPDCTEQESVITLLRATPKIDQDLDLLLYLRNGV